MRLKALKKNLVKKGKLPYLITDLVNIRYCTGFSGSYGCLLVDGERTYFISDSRYEEYARSLLGDDVTFVLQKKSLPEALKKLLGGIGAQRLNLEEHNLPLSMFMQLKKELPDTELLPAGDEVNLLRMCKDDSEIELIRKAVRIADDCFRHILRIIKPGVREWDIYVEIDYFYKKNGCRRTSFDSIVASGKSSSMPHYSTSMTKRVNSGDIVMIDMGCEYEGYNSDLTRTVFVNSVDAEFKNIYTTVREAQERALSVIRPGISAGSCDGTARRIIKDAGYGGAFGHSLGHGVGLEVHELPALKSGGTVKLKKNMVITVEPGIYLPEKGGVRIEDMALVTDNGVEILTGSSKELFIL